MAPATCEALVIHEINDKSTHVKQQIPTPEPAAHQVLVKVSHVAQNPTDVQCFDIKAFGNGTVLGCDFVGTVDKIGANVTRVAVGDTIAGLIWGGEVKSLGAYSEYTIADEKICFRVPEGATPDQLATVPLAACTSLLALFSKGSLAIDQKSCAGQTILVWGGSSSVGLYAVQIARLYGMEVIATCSPKHFDLVKSVGAKHVFDYRGGSVVDDIKAAAPDLSYIFDTIGSETTSQVASEAITTAGGTLCTVRPGKVFTDKCSKQTMVTDVLVWTAFLSDHRYKEHFWPANEDDHRLSADFFDALPSLIRDGKIKANNTKVYTGGLDDVDTGFQEHRDGQISGYKIVYQL